MGGRTVPRFFRGLAPREMTESGLERSGKRLRVALHSTKWILEGGCGGENRPAGFSTVGASRDDGKRLGAERKAAESCTSLTPVALRSEATKVPEPKIWHVEILLLLARARCIFFKK